MAAKIERSWLAAVAAAVCIAGFTALQDSEGTVPFRLLTPVRLVAGTCFGMTLTVSSGAEKVTLAAENGEPADEDALLWPTFELKGENPR